VPLDGLGCRPQRSRPVLTNWCACRCAGAKRALEADGDTEDEEDVGGSGRAAAGGASGEAAHKKPKSGE
jgi:hypothetical protein